MKTFKIEWKAEKPCASTIRASLWHQKTAQIRPRLSNALWAIALLGLLLLYYWYKTSRHSHSISSDADDETLGAVFISLGVNVLLSAALSYHIFLLTYRRIRKAHVKRILGQLNGKEESIAYAVLWCVALLVGFFIWHVTICAIQGTSTNTAEADGAYVGFWFCFVFWMVVHSQ